MVRAEQLEGAPESGGVAWIGIGKMGRPMSRRLLQDAWSVGIRSRSLSADDELVRAGAELLPSTAAATKYGIICLTLHDDAQVESVFEELLPSLRSGHLVVDFGTTSPSLTRNLAETARRRGARVVDAPISGGPQGAEAGTLAIMVGASASGNGELAGLFSCLGRPTWFGGVGRGQIAKLCNQIVVGCGIAAVAEALELAKAYGEPLELVLEAFGNGAADSWVVRTKGHKMIDGDWAPQGTAETHLKDLGLARGAAANVDVRLALTSVVCDWYEALVAAGMGGLDHCSLALVPPPTVTTARKEE